MELRVQRCEEGCYRLTGVGADVELANRFLTHLVGRNFAVATRRAYAFDLLNFLRFCQLRGLGLAGFRTSDLFDYLDWQASPVPGAGRVVVRLAERSGAAPATVNRRVAAIRGMFEFVMLTGGRADNPVPLSRRVGSGHSRRRGLLGHLGTSRHRTGGRLVVQPRTLPESLDLAEVRQFVADLVTARDRAIALAMLLGGLRAGEVRSLLLADIDFGMRRLRVTGKGGKERMVPVGAAFFTEVASYLRLERPQGCPTPECFVVLRGPTTGQPMTEAGMRRIFRTHRSRAGTPRVRPHRLRHTYGTELAAAGIDLLVLRELMGHASPETTARYVHLSIETLSVEYSAALAKAEEMRR